MNLKDKSAFNKIIQLKQDKIDELKDVIYMLQDENSLAYHDTTIFDLKNKIRYIEDKIQKLYKAKDDKKSMDTIRKMAYKAEKPPHLVKKSPDVLFENYQQLLDSCERITLDFMAYRKRFGS